MGMVYPVVDNRAVVITCSLCEEALELPQLQQTGL